MLDKLCFSIDSYFEFKELIKLKKNKKRILTIFIKNYLVKGFGIEWLTTLLKMIRKNYPEYNIKFFIDAGSDYGLSILIIRENVNYIKLRSNSEILHKIKQIAKKNNILLNPKFNVVDFKKIKNYAKLKL